MKTGKIKKLLFLCGAIILLVGLGGCGKENESNNATKTDQTTQAEKVVGEKNAMLLVKMLKDHPAKIAMGTNANRDIVVVRDWSIGSDGKKHAFDDESTAISSYVYCRKHGMIHAQEEALNYFVSGMKDDEGKKISELFRGVDPENPLLVPDGAGADYLTISNPKVKVKKSQAYLSGIVTVYYHLSDGVEKTKKFKNEVEVKGTTDKLSDSMQRGLETSDVVFNEPLEYSISDNQS